MTLTLASGRTVLTGDEAAAHAVVLARARAIGVYPITPQTIIDDIEYENVESEHSMFGYVIAASRAGVRTFTATSSQGLLYAHEQLHRASRERVPLVAVNVNRSVLAPWSLEPDLTDSLSQRDTGWIQLYCSSAQEVLDDILCAYRIAEAVMLPVLVNVEGFLLSHTSEVVEVPDQEAVDAFLREFDPPVEWLLDPDRPRTYSALPQPDDYYAFQRHVAEAMDETRGVIEDVTAEFGSHFGRPKAGALDVAGNPEADTALVTMATMGDTALELLGDDEDVLLVRVHAYRPFPTEELASVLARTPRVCVVDRAVAFGSFGPLGADVRSLSLRDADAVVNVICGIGGTEVTPHTLRWAIRETRAASDPVLEPVYVPEGVH
jgi:pyruvate ferredoxin oxidoreductase alpha subunit